MNLRNSVVEVARGISFRTGILQLMHRIRNRRTLTVLMFHRVLPCSSDEFRRAEREYTFSVEGFSQCLDFIKRHYNVVDLASVIDAAEGNRPLPNCAALITFDDGWRDTVLYALPELQQRKLPAVLFLSTEVVGLEESRWWQDALVEIASDTERSRQLAKDLGHDLLEVAHLHEMTAMLAALPSTRRDMLTASYVQQTGGRQMLTDSDVVALDQQCLALAAHGHTHAPLTHVAVPLVDLETSHERIRDMGGWPSVMSFPHGAFNEEVVIAARAAGFELVFTSQPFINSTSLLNKSRLFARLHVPENQWTCTDDRISDAKMASFLFFRTIQSAE